MADKSVKGKVIVITGASSGFGKGAALKFAKAGASVVLAARRDELLEELARQCESAGGRAIAVATDVGDPAQVENLAAAAISEFARIDVWVNNAGAGAIGWFDEVPLADHVQVIATDLLGTMYGCYHAMRQFRAQGFGVLINIASVLGKVPAPYFASYAAAKHGVVGLGGCIRQELEQNDVKDIHVCTVMPTSMDTPFFQHAASYTGHEFVPPPPVYDPQEVIDVIFKLAIDPEPEVSVGNAGTMLKLVEQLSPRLGEKLMGRQTHKAQVEAPPRPDTPGSLKEPSPIGSGVTGGWRKK